MTKIEIKLKQSPEPNIADVKTQVEGKYLIITYPTNENLHDPNSNFAPSAKIKFSDVIDYRFGRPNDEAFYSEGNDGINYHLLRFELDKLYEVKDLENGFGIRNQKYLSDETFKHFIFFVKEGTFECIAKDIELNN